MAQMNRQLEVVDFRSAKDLPALKALLDRQFTALQRQYRTIYNDANYSLSPTVALHKHDGHTLEHDGVNSDGGAFAFNTTGGVTFNQAITAPNAILNGTVAIGLDMSGGTFATGGIKMPDTGTIFAAGGPTIIFNDTDNALQITGETTPQIFLATTDLDQGVVGSFLQFRLAADTGDTYGVIQQWDAGGTDLEALLIQPYGPGLIVGGSEGVTVPLAVLHVVGDGLFTGIVKTQSGRIVNTSRYTTTQTLDETDHHVFCDTDGGAFTVTLPAGVAGTCYRIVNTGTSANNLTIAPNGAELLIGVNSSFVLGDGEALIIVYEATEGWA